MNPQNKPVKISGNPPAISADGHGIGINPDNGAANLLFIQIIPSQDKDPKELEGNVVASIRLTLEQLEQLNNDISKNIKTYKDSKKK